MRITGLLVVLLLILLFFFAAPAASYAQTATSVKCCGPVLTARTHRRARLGTSCAGTAQNSRRTASAYTMRTYVVAREDKDSDVTRPVRVTRCLPATKLEFKSAIAPVRSEDDSREQR